MRLRSRDRRPIAHSSGDETLAGFCRVRDRRDDRPPDVAGGHPAQRSGACCTIGTERHNKRVAIIDLFSKRAKRQESHGKADVYQYDEIPEGLRIQVVHIWRDALGQYWRDTTGYSSVPASPACELWERIHDIIAKEKGLWGLGKPHTDPSRRCEEYLMTTDTNGALDIIELSFKVIDRIVREFSEVERERASIRQSADDATNELNGRFLEHGVGYQYMNGKIVRIDSQFIHAETVKPALALLNEAGFSGPSDEFMRAFDHHRKGNNKEAIAEALKAFESTIKAICAARKWAHPPNATAKPLMDVLFQNGLIPPELESHFAALRTAMESGLPTLANRTSRHGQGSTPIDIPPRFAAYALHLVASNIVFLIQSHQAKR